MHARNKKRLTPQQPLSFSPLQAVGKIILFAGTISLLMLTTSPASVRAEESCPELLTNRCEKCHYVTRVCQKVERKKGKSSWKRTVRNMVRQGAKLNKAEQKKLATCLSKPSPEILEFCGLKKD